MHIGIFEDELVDNFYPLSLSRPVFDLLYGMNTLRARILHFFPDAKYSLFCRDYLKETVKQNNLSIDVNELIDDNYLFINGRVAMDGDLYKTLTGDLSEKLFKKNDTLIAARVLSGTVNKIKIKMGGYINFSYFEGISEEQVEVETVSFVWDLIKNNGRKLREDFKDKSSIGISEQSMVYRGANLINKDEIIIESGSVIKPGVVIDASGGPVFIDKDVEIYPNSVIEGPVFIGEKSKIKSCATIYENVTIGKICKIGGEVEESVIMPYSNKQHSGFLGHAYLGSWVNLGADTNCSDLKNNYGSIKLDLRGKKIDTGLQFLGLIMGDHSKTSINSMFNTGTIAGFSCNIFGNGFPDKFIPSFSWGGKENMEIYEVEKSAVTAKKVMQRRNVEMTKADEDLFKTIFNLTKSERQK